MLEREIRLLLASEENDVSIIKSIPDDIEHNEQMKGKYGRRYYSRVYFLVPIESDCHLTKASNGFGGLKGVSQSNGDREG